MTPTQLTLIFLGMPFLAGLVIPFFSERSLLQRAIWIAVAIPALSLIFLWLGMIGGNMKVIGIARAGAAILLWGIAGFVGVLVGREAANVRRDAHNAKEKHKASEIFR